MAKKRKEKNIMFTYAELMTISQALIDAMDRCNQAKQLVNSSEALQAINAECEKLNTLNTKVCKVANNTANA